MRASLWTDVFWEYAVRNSMKTKRHSRRRSRSRTRFYAGGCALGLALVATPAHAYGDPGSGALLWQLIVAGMFGFLFYIRQTVRKLREWFGPKPPASSNPEE